MKHFIGFDIGGTKCAVSLGIENGGGTLKILAKKILPTSVNGAEDFLLELAEHAKSLSSEAGVSLSEIEAAGVSCGGFIDVFNGLVVTTPVIPTWRNVKVVQILEKALEIPVFIQNDANACALVEWIWGAGKGSKNMVFLTCGTGLGAGIIINGALYLGANGNAGEVGHMRIAPCGPVACGKSGSYESFASGAGIAELGKIRAKEILQSGEKCGFCESEFEIEKITAKSLAEAVERGDEEARKVYEKAGDYLGQGIAIICDILNPELVVIGSVFQRSENLLRPSMEKSFKREAMRFSYEVCKVVPAKLADNVGDFAAIAVAVNGNSNH